MRNEIFHAMGDSEDVQPRLSNENLLINELIREYLEFNNYKHTLSVFLPETGQPAEPMRRQFLSHQTHLPHCVSGGEGGHPVGEPLPLL